MLGRAPDHPGPDVDDLHELSRRHGAVVVSFGDVVAPDGRWWACRTGGPGLGTSGSGDVLAGLVAGAAARCREAAQAACWGTWAHATSGRRLASSVHEVGFIAREIADEVPATMRTLAAAAPVIGAPGRGERGGCIRERGGGYPPDMSDAPNPDQRSQDRDDEDDTTASQEKSRSMREADVANGENPAE